MPIPGRYLSLILTPEPDAPYFERANQERVVFLVLEHQTEVDSLRFRPKAPELWAEVTIPRRGPPRPIRLGLKRDGELNRCRLVIAAALALIVAGFFLFVPRIAQDETYNLFADNRGIPNFRDVASNLPFAIVGILGLWNLRGGGDLVLFTGVQLTFFGSAYYHLAPSDVRLVWDRLPMTLVFMPLLAWVGRERALVEHTRRTIRCRHLGALRSRETSRILRSCGLLLSAGQRPHRQARGRRTCDILHFSLASDGDQRSSQGERPVRVSGSCSY